MTREGQGEGPEDVERPLASTRWSGPGGTPDDDLLPPFVPGRSRQPPDEAGTEEEALPFESPGAWDEPFQFEPDASREGIDDFGLPGEELPDGSGFDDAAPTDTPAGDPWSTEAWVPEEADTDEPAVEPWGTEEPGADPWATVEPSLDEPGTDETGAHDGGDGGVAAELAMRLEDLAARIRSDGAEGARAGMASSDRLTALLSSLIAGYLEGREG
jgi:hypothetical protein